MTDFETHPVGTTARIAELTAAQKYRYIGKDGKPVLARDLEDRIEQLVATVEQLETALTRANAATAAAYEVAAQKAEYFRDVCGRNQDGDFYVGEEATMFGNSVATEITDAIRALATPDQTATLDKLFAEAVADRDAKIEHLNQDLIDMRDNVEIAYYRGYWAGGNGE